MNNIPKDVLEKIESEALKEEIYPKKYGSGSREGYDTRMLYEINYERSECFEKGAKFGYSLSQQPLKDIEELAKEYAEKEYPIKAEEDYYKDNVDEPYYDYSSAAFVLQTRIRAAFKDGAASQQSEQGEWVSVEDRMPESFDAVLVAHIEAGGVVTAYYDDEDKKWIQCDRPNQPNETLLVTHWMPLPSPPKT